MGERALERFRENRPCPKCNGSWITTVYIGGEDTLQRQCQRCRYAWKELPIDHGGGEGSRDDTTDEFVTALGGELGGRIEGNTWRCVCGDGGSEIDEQHASLALYFHRRWGHQAVEVATSVRDEAIIRLGQIVRGIDETQSDSEDGWWETSVGAAFGAAKFRELEALVIALTREGVADGFQSISASAAECERLRFLLVLASPYVRCDVEPCDCGRDALYADILRALDGEKGDR